MSFCHLKRQGRPWGARKLPGPGTTLKASGCFCSCHHNHQRAALVTRRVNNLSHGPGCPSVSVDTVKGPSSRRRGKASGKEGVRDSERECGRLGAHFFPPGFWGSLVLPSCDLSFSPLTPPPTFPHFCLSPPPTALPALAPTHHLGQTVKMPSGVHGGSAVQCT